jgi:hypothetical protein
MTSHEAMWLCIAIWFTPALIATLKLGPSAGAGFAVGLVGLALVSVFVLPLAIFWLLALLIALIVPGRG